MTTSAIPTDYAGVHFRSRLEARYAAMFDLFGWMWEYEPVDLDGYIPDFLLRDVIMFSRANKHPADVLVEIKPSYAELREAINKIALSGWYGPACVLLAMPDRYQPPASSTRVPPVEMTFGRASEEVYRHHADPTSMAWMPIAPWRHSERCHERVDRCWLESGWTLECCGYERDLLALWREAGNRVQWRAP